MGDWAERMIIKELHEENKIKQEKIVLQNKIVKKKMHEANTLAMRLFHVRHVDGERFWSFIAYAYFVCKTLGLLILIGLLFFGRLRTMVSIFISLLLYYLNLKLYRLCFRKKDQG